MALAAATVGLGLVTNRLGSFAGRQLELEQRRLEAGQRPHVYPAANPDWIEGSGRYSGSFRWNQVLPVKNGGPGVALNVRGQLHFGPPTGAFVAVVPTSLAPGESADLVLNWGSAPISGWKGASGFLLYNDIAGVRWRTDYRVREDVRRSIEVVKSEMFPKVSGFLARLDPDELG